MKGVRALASGMLVLAAICAVPAISAAQDAGTTTATPAATTTTTPTEPTSTLPDAPPEGASAGDLSPKGRPAADEPSRGSVGVPAAAPSDVASAASAPKAKKSSSASVTMINLAFSPPSVTVNVGDAVTWRNSDDAPHNARADDGSFSTPTIDKGQSTSHTFTQAGSFSYICTIHPQMKGTVRVLASSTGGGNSGSDSTGSSTSEASAVASPDAAGDANTLPMTGMAAGALALVGLAMLGSGLLVKAWERRGRPERQLKLF